MINYFNDRSWMYQRREISGANRSKNPVTHRGGSKSFQHHREDLERSRGVPVGLVDLFAHTHAARQVDDAGNITYEWGEHDRATEAYARLQEAKAYALEQSGRDDLTQEEQDNIFNAVMDPPQRSRRFGYGNVTARSAQKAQDREEIKELRAMVQQLQEENRLQAIQMEQLNQKLAEYVQNHGNFPSSSAASGDGNDA